MISPHVVPLQWINTIEWSLAFWFREMLGPIPVYLLLETKIFFYIVLVVKSTRLEYGKIEYSYLSTFFAPCVRFNTKKCRKKNSTFMNDPYSLYFNSLILLVMTWVANKLQIAFEKSKPIQVYQFFLIWVDHAPFFKKKKKWKKYPHGCFEIFYFS